MYKRTSIFGTLIAAVALLAMSASAQTILNVTLGASSSQYGVTFTGGGGTGNLAVVIGACPFSSMSCSGTGSIGGAINVGIFSGTYSLSTDSLTASFLNTSPSGVDNWSLSGSADTFSLGVTGFTGGFGGTINWLGIVENTSGVFLLGSVNYSGTGAFSASSGTVGVNVALAPITCNFTPSSANPCTLANISGEKGDPPAAFSSVGSGSFSNTPPVIGATPEPGSLLLLGTGLLCVAPFIRRRFARA